MGAAKLITEKNLFVVISKLTCKNKKEKHNEIDNIEKVNTKFKLDTTYF